MDSLIVREVPLSGLFGLDVDVDKIDLYSTQPFLVNFENSSTSMYHSDYMPHLNNYSSREVKRGNSRDLVECLQEETVMCIYSPLAQLQTHEYTS